MIRALCPLHELELISISQSLLTEEPFYNKKGMMRSRTVSKRGYTQQCPKCMNLPWWKHDSYAGYNYTGDYGNEYRSGIICHEGIAIQAAHLSLGIEYESSNIVVTAYDLQDHFLGMKTFNEKLSIEDWHLSFRFERPFFYPNHNPQLLNMFKLIRILRLAVCGDDFIERIGECW